MTRNPLGVSTSRRAGEAGEEVAGDLLDRRVGAGQPVSPVRAAGRDDGAAARRGVRAEDGVAVLHPGEQSRALSRRLRFMALHLMVEARGGEPTP